jgi:hypothetical protein
VNDVVELSYSGVPDLGAGESVLSLDLRTEMAEHDDGGLVRTKEERANEEVGSREGGRVAVETEKEVSLVSLREAFRRG